MPVTAKESNNRVEIPVKNVILSGYDFPIGQDVDICDPGETFDIIV